MPLWMQIVTTVLGWVISMLTILWKISRDKKTDNAQRKREEDARYKAFEGLINNIAKTNSDGIGAIQRQIDRTFPELQHSFENSIAALRLEFEQRLQTVINTQDRKRSDDIKAVNDRIANVETKFASEVMERLGALEGTMGAKFDSIENTLGLIQRHFIEN